MADGRMGLENGLKEMEIASTPEDWQVWKLGDVADLKLGHTPARKETRYWHNGIIPWIKVQDLNNAVVSMSSEAISLEAFAEIFKGRFIPRGTLLLSFKLTIGKVGVLGIDAVHNEAIASVFPQEHIAEREFLFYLFQFIDYDTYLDSYVKGKTLNKRKLRALPIPLPPLHEQRKIAKILSNIQGAIEQQDNVIAAARELRKSLMRHLFTYGPVPVAEAERVPLRETEIGRVPEHWDVVRLGQVVQPERGMKRGPWGGSIKKEIFVPYGYKVYEQKNVIANDFRIGSYFIDEDKFIELIDFEVQAGDVLITAAGTIGKLAIVPENAHRGIINQALIRIRLNENVIFKRYFKYAFSLLVDHRVLDGISHGATLRNLSSVKVLGNIPTPLPPLPEQREIATILSTVDGKIEAEEQRKAVLRVLFKTMLYKLMTGHIRVKDIEV